MELLVVVAIIGILSTVVVTLLNSARIDGRDAKRLADLKEIQTAVQLYYDDFSEYPAAISDLVPTYLSALPGDPLGQTPYFYDQTGSGAGYHLGAELEDATHQAFNSDLDTASDTMNGADSADCGGGSISGRRCYDVGP